MRSARFLELHFAVRRQAILQLVAFPSDRIHSLFNRQLSRELGGVWFCFQPVDFWAFGLWGDYRSARSQPVIARQGTA